MDRITAITKSLDVFADGIYGSVIVFGFVPVCFLIERVFIESNKLVFGPEPMYWGPIILLAVIGSIAALCALLKWSRISIRYGNQWNPAADYLSWGVRLAVLSLLFSALIVSAIFLTIA